MLINLSNSDSPIKKDIYNRVNVCILNRISMTEKEVQEIVAKYPEDVEDITGNLEARVNYGWSWGTLRYLFKLDGRTIFFPDSEMVSTPSNIDEKFKNSGLTKDEIMDIRRGIVKELRAINYSINKLLQYLEEDNK